MRGTTLLFHCILFTALLIALVLHDQADKGLEVVLFETDYDHVYFQKSVELQDSTKNDWFLNSFILINFILKFY